MGNFFDILLVKYLLEKQNVKVVKGLHNQKTSFSFLQEWKRGKGCPNYLLEWFLTFVNSPW